MGGRDEDIESFHYRILKYFICKLCIEKCDISLSTIFCDKRELVAILYKKIETPLFLSRFFFHFLIFHFYI